MRLQRLIESPKSVIRGKNAWASATASLLETTMIGSLVAAVAATNTRAVVTPNFSAARLSIPHWRIDFKFVARVEIVCRR
jgi:hypothetical protein